MKIYIVIFISLLFMAFTPYGYTQDEEFEFGIHATIKLNDIKPLTENQSKSVLNQDLKLDAPIVAYLGINDKEYIKKQIEHHSSPRVFMLPVKSFDGNSSQALVSLKKEAALGIEDLSKAISSGSSIELRFNYRGARKFAKLTQECTGSMIAFVINGEIWSLPRVNAPIKSGVALIQGINDRKLADKTANQINAAIEILK